MTDYTELVNNLRLTERVCRDRMDGQVMLDAAAAIEELQAELQNAHNDGYDVGYYDGRRDYEPKHGKWIDRATEFCYRCSVCGEFATQELPHLLYHYCPNCGAKMNDSNASNASNALNALDNAQDGPIITPCRGCSDYDGYGGCKSKGGCARAKMEVQDEQK